MLDEKSVQHHCDLLTTLDRFRREDLYCDVKLTFGEQAISAHGAILAAASPVFHDMLKEQTQATKTQIQLNNMSLETGEIIVEHIYTGSTNRVTKKTVCELLPSVHAFGLKRLIEACENVLLSMANTKRCLEVWKTATSVNMWSIITKCTLHIRRTFPKDFTCSYFLTMSFADAAFLISECPLKGEQRMEAIRRWVHHDPRSRAEYIEQFQQKFPYLINPLEEMKAEDLESNDRLLIQRESKPVKRKHGDVIAENIIYVDDEESILTKPDSDSVQSPVRSADSGHTQQVAASPTGKEPVHMTRSITKVKITKTSKKTRASKQRTTRSLSEVIAAMTYDRPTAMQITKTDASESDVPDHNLDHHPLSEQSGQMEEHQGTNVAKMTDDTSTPLLNPNEQTDLDAHSEHTASIDEPIDKLDVAMTTVDHSEVSTSTDEPMDILNAAIASTIHSEVTAPTDELDVTITTTAHSEDSEITDATDQPMDNLDAATHSEDSGVSASTDGTMDKHDVAITAAAHSEDGASTDGAMDKHDVAITAAAHSEDSGVSASTDGTMDKRDVAITAAAHSEDGASTDGAMDKHDVVITAVAHSEDSASRDKTMDKHDSASTDEAMDKLDVSITPAAHSEVSASTDEAMDKLDVSIAPAAHSEVSASTDESVDKEASKPNINILLTTENNGDTAEILNENAQTLPCITDNDKTQNVRDSDDFNGSSVEVFYDDNTSIVDVSNLNNTRSTFLIIPEQAMFDVADILTIGTTVVNDTGLIFKQPEAIHSKHKGGTTYESHGNNSTSMKIESTSIQIESTEFSAEQQENLQCEICKTPFSSPEMLRVHLSKGHGDNSSAFVFVPDETLLAVSDMLAVESNIVYDADYSPPYISHTTQTKVSGSNVNITNGTIRVETRMLTRQKKSHQCSSCEKNYHSLRALRSHTQKCHGEDALICLNDELRANTNSEQSFLCQICGKSYTSAYSLRYHMKFHPGEDWRQKNPSILKNCPLCNKGFPSLSQIRRHIKLSHKDKEYFIPDGRPKALSKSVRPRPKPNANGNYECSECGKDFPTLTGMRAHSFSHSDKLYECDICSKKFRFERICLKHKETQHVDWNCTICGKKFNCHMYLQRHLKAHKETKSEECKVCGKWFTPTVLRCHMYTHKRYFCDVCGKVIMNRASFVKHKLKHSPPGETNPENPAATKPEEPAATKPKKQTATKPKKPAEKRAKRMKKQPTADIKDEQLECPICKKQVKSKKALAFHTRTHSIQKQFKCQICSKSFRTLESCRYHVTFHPGQNWRESRSSLLHRCAVCNKGFPTNSQVTRHMAQHRLGTDVECKLCGASYQTQQYLKAHMKAHKRNPNWGRTKESLRQTCDMCERAFVSIRQLKRHKKSHSAGSKPGTGLKGNIDAGIKSEDKEISDTEQD